MIIRVDTTLALPVYEQIRSQVVRMVVAGTLQPGTRMPTIRQLANDLKLAKGTVAKAYALLEGSEILESRGHKGTFISAASAQAGGDEAKLDQALADAADAYTIAARQMGVDLDLAIKEIQRRWDQI
ncbi:MAG: GntR family transcriptional regulator [bacterium]|nr:GntR family transcriptional regulator [bacterium]